MPACTTPELWPVWCAASRSSFSSTTTSVPGRRRTTSRAIATPRMPPPTTPTRCSPMVETLVPRRGRRQATPAFIPQWGDARPPRPRRPGPARGPGRARRRAGGALLEVAGPGRAVGQHHRLAGGARARRRRLHGAHRRPAGPGAAALADGTDHRRGVGAPLPAPQPRRRARAPRRPAARGAGTAPAAAAAHATLTRGQGAAAQGEEGARLDQGPPRPGAGPGPDGPQKPTRRLSPAAARRTTSPFAWAVSASSAW